METNIERIEQLEETVQEIKKALFNKDLNEGDKISGMSVYDYFTKLGRQDNKEWLDDQDLFKYYRKSNSIVDSTNRIEQEFEKALESKKIDTLIDEKCNQLAEAIKNNEGLRMINIDLCILIDQKEELNK